MDPAGEEWAIKQMLFKQGVTVSCKVLLKALHLVILLTDCNETWCFRGSLAGYPRENGGHKPVSWPTGAVYSTVEQRTRRK